MFTCLQTRLKLPLQGRIKYFELKIFTQQKWIVFCKLFPLWAPRVWNPPCVCRVCFPVQINQLPRESQLTVTLYASSLPPPGGAEEKGKQRRSVEALGWVTMPLFNFRQWVTGRHCTCKWFRCFTRYTGAIQSCDAWGRSLVNTASTCTVSPVVTSDRKDVDLLRDSDSDVSSPQMSSRRPQMLILNIQMTRKREILM